MDKSELQIAEDLLNAELGTTGLTFADVQSSLSRFAPSAPTVTVGSRDAGTTWCTIHIKQTNTRVISAATGLAVTFGATEDENYWKMLMLMRAKFVFMLMLSS